MMAAAHENHADAYVGECQMPADTKAAGRL